MATKSARTRVPITKPGAARPLGKNDPRRLLLWVLAGGRCELCNVYLLNCESQGDAIFYPLGEIAHNVGRSEDGPRGADPLPLAQRNALENLLLLCPSCHVAVDHRLKLNELTVELLRARKRDHEARIYHLTSIAPDRRSCVVRVVSKIHGNAVDISAAELRGAVVRETGRYPQYAFGVHEIDIDLRGLVESNDETYWEAGRRIIDERLVRLLNLGLEGKVPSHVSMFGLARIPFLTYFGAKYGDKIPTTIFQKQRLGEQPWEWRSEPVVAFTWRTVQEREGARWGILLSVSGQIEWDSLPEQVRETFSLVEVRPDKVDPGREVMACAASLESFRSTYAHTLRHVERAGAQEIALFPALPVSAAVVCGREILPAVTPPLTVFDNIKGKFIPTITISYGTL